RTLSRVSGESESDCARQAFALSVRSADCEPRFPAKTPDHGSSPVELVPSLRPQSTDLRAEYLLGEARELQEGDAAGVSRAEPGEFRGVATGENALVQLSFRIPARRDEESVFPSGISRFIVVE